MEDQVEAAEQCRKQLDTFLDELVSRPLSVSAQAHVGCFLQLELHTDSLRVVPPAFYTATAGADGDGRSGSKKSFDDIDLDDDEYDGLDMAAATVRRDAASFVLDACTHTALLICTRRAMRPDHQLSMLRYTADLSCAW